MKKVTLAKIDKGLTETGILAMGLSMELPLLITLAQTAAKATPVGRAICYTAAGITGICTGYAVANISDHICKDTMQLAKFVDAVEGN